MGLVSGPALGAPFLLHLRLENVALTLLQFVADTSLVITEDRPVPVVELLDHLKGPATLEHVAPDEFDAEPLGYVPMAGLFQRFTCLAQQQVGTAHQLMEGVQVSAGAFDPFERLGDFSDRLDGVLVDTLAALAGNQVFVRHAGRIPGRTGHNR